MPRRLLPMIIVLALLGAAGAGGWYWWAELRFRESTDNAYVRGELAVISPRIAGYVAEIAVADNQEVRRGDLLVRLDAAEFRARRDEADADIAAAHAAMSTLDSQIALQERKIAQARAELDGARADVDLATSNLDRYVSLAARDNASRQRLDEARNAAIRNRASVAAADAAVGAAEGERAVLEARRVSAAADLQHAEAARDLATIELEHATITAPIDGVVGNKSVQLGDYLKVGARIMALVPIRELYVEANFKETQIGALRVGGPVNLAIDAFPGQEVTGTITSLAPASGATFSLLPPENATGNFTKIVQRVPVRIALPAEGPLAGRLRPGLSVVVTADRRAMPADGAALAVVRE